MVIKRQAVRGSLMLIVKDFI